MVNLSRIRSIRATARSMNLKASHVSKILTRMESKLEAPLLKRGSKGVLLTREGMAFADLATRILEVSEKQSSPSENRENKIVTVGALSFLNKALLAPALSFMRQPSPYRFRVLDISPDQLLEAAMNGAVDIVLHTDPSHWTKAWDVSLIASVQWALCANPSHPLGESATLSEVLKFPFVVPTYWQDNDYVIGNDHFPVPWESRIRGDEASCADTAAQIVLATNQLAFLPFILKKTLTNGSLMEVSLQDVKPISRKIYLGVKSDTVGISLKRDLLKALKKVCE